MKRGRRRRPRVNFAWIIFKFNSQYIRNLVENGRKKRKKKRNKQQKLTLGCMKLNYRGIPENSRSARAQHLSKGSSDLD